MTVLAIVLICAGIAFLVVSAAGLVVFPDFYTRAHVIATSESFGVMLVLGGVIVHHGFGSSTYRLALLLVLAAVANPTAAHVLARARWMSDDPTPEALEVPDGWETSTSGEPEPAHRPTTAAERAQPPPAGGAS